MRVDEIDALFRRMDRLSASLQVKNGAGSEWDATDADGQTHSYRIRNVRPIDEIEDDIANLFLWVWNLKDYLKELSSKRGKNAQWIEQLVNQDPHLPICADIANRLKHGVLKTSRSDRFPQLQRAGYNVSVEAIGSITIGILQVEVDIADPNFIDIVMGVEDRNGELIGDAFAYLRGAIDTWESAFEQLRALPDS
jgi:hypothetical protein